MHDRDDSRRKPLIFAPCQQRLLHGGEEHAQLRSVPPEDIPKLCRNREHDMVIGNVHEPAQGLFNPLIHHDFPAGGAEP